ncbi:unnamed protein product [Bursaphelenchus okinawaensis]|uniref:LAG1_DNAbind domain-containing protein n=1 Tax=Bursaphelenchus okinawaensis TaxID=465554 RepID=A0A811KY59_9BILA|nr:unnamed protein product [Bursaphelenchus okinawaensis]CAG9112917.1 unnamed protein product [Bursaphelenchus okinawaensis]
MVSQLRMVERRPHLEPTVFKIPEYLSDIILSGTSEYPAKTHYALPPVPLQPSFPLYMGQQKQRLTVDVMKNYLMHSEELDCTVKIFHAKVAQKSYGNEKRFFCPPPSVYLSGPGWNRKRENFERLIENYNGYEVRCTGLMANIGIMGSKYSEPQMLDFSNGKEFCPAKNLYVSDQDKRKFFHLQVHVSFNCSHNIGSFISERIKVISKPSKKKQTVKGNDCNFLCINSGTKVALFNRLRSQTISTRYLHVDNGSFHASPAKWGAFKIHLIDENTPDDNVIFEHKSGFVYYGNVVKLVDSCSDLSLPKMRIRKCDKNNVVIDEEVDEPVSQLHRVAFQVIDTPEKSVYLALNGDNIFQQICEQNERGQHIVSEGAAWTIISAEKNEFRFYEAMGTANFPVAPIPRIDSMLLQSKAAEDARGLKGGTYAIMRGRDLHPKVKVWFGTIEANTQFLSNETIEVEVPTRNQVYAHLPFLEKLFYEEGQLVLPICLVRDDGVIYYNDCTFSFYLNDTIVREICNKVAECDIVNQPSPPSAGALSLYHGMLDSDEPQSSKRSRLS